eukprot:scaffold46402_cov153-Amphora_coffeaeformis.AAC.1
MSGRSFRSSLRRMDKSIRDGFKKMVSTSSIPADPYKPLPEAYYCKITFNLMHDPVIDCEGNTYERVAIENWVRANGNSPLTRTALQLDQLYPNKALVDLLEEEKFKDDESIHPSIRRFQLETPPEPTDPEVGGTLPTNTAAETGVTVEHQQEEPNNRCSTCAVWTTLACGGSNNSADNDGSF